MLKFRFALVLAAGLALVGSAAAAPATHKIKVGKLGHEFKSAGKAIAVVAKDSVVTSFDTLEAGVDMIGVGLQGVADGLDGIAIVVKPVVPPVYYGLHVVYIGLDKAGQFLAQ